MTLNAIYKCTSTEGGVEMSVGDEMTISLFSNGRLKYEFGFSGGNHVREYFYTVNGEKLYIYETAVALKPCNVFSFKQDEIISEEGGAKFVFNRLSEPMLAH